MNGREKLAKIADDIFKESRELEDTVFRLECLIRNENLPSEIKEAALKMRKQAYHNCELAQDFYREFGSGEGHEKKKTD